MKKLLVVVFAIFTMACENEERGKGDVLYAKGKYKEAISAYNEYLKLHPEHVKSLYNRGRSYEELGQFEKAFADFTLVADLDKKNTSAMLSLSKHNYRIKKYEESRFFAEKALKINNELAEGHFWLGRANHHMGEFNLAVSAYNNAINLNRNYGEAYLYRGAIKMQGNKKKAACSDFKSALKNGLKEAQKAIDDYCK